MDKKVLIVDDERNVRDILERKLKSIGYQTKSVENADRAISALQEDSWPVVMTDLSMPGGMTGMDLLKKIKEDDVSVEVIIMTGFATVKNAVEAMKEGAYDYVTKPFQLHEIENTLERLFQARNLQSENRQLRKLLQDKYGLQGLVGSSAGMQEVFRVILKVSENRSTVLIQGESGTGKELVAKAVHFSGPNSEKPFVPINCGAISPNVIESELFGHVKGAFTSAHSHKEGLFKVAHGGTIFLDEISEIPPNIQVKLLRAIQEREIRPVGSTENLKVDCRVIAATNRDLEAGIKDGSFRQDLFYRLNVVNIRIPPLRERKDDIPLLIDHFIKQFNSNHKRFRGISREALNALTAYDWPGNVRELENCIERAFALGSGELIELEDIPRDVFEKGKEQARTSGGGTPTLEEYERLALLESIRAAGGNKLEAAKLLGVSKSAFYRKLKKHQIS